MKTRRSVILYYRHNFQEKKKYCLLLFLMCQFSLYMSFYKRYENLIPDSNMLNFRESLFLTDLPATLFFISITFKRLFNTARVRCHKKVDE